MARGFASRGSGFRGNFRGRSGGFRGRGGRGRGGSLHTGGVPKPSANDARQDEASKAAEKLEQAMLEDEIDAKLGFARFHEGPKREGWLVNMHPVRLQIHRNDIHGRSISHLTSRCILELFFA